MARPQVSTAATSLMRSAIESVRTASFEARRHQIVRDREHRHRQLEFKRRQNEALKREEILIERRLKKAVQGVAMIFASTTTPEFRSYYRTFKSFRFFYLDDGGGTEGFEINISPKRIDLSIWSQGGAPKFKGAIRINSADSKHVVRKRLSQIAYARKLNLRQAIELYDTPGSNPEPDHVAFDLFCALSTAHGFEQYFVSALRGNIPDPN